jgi:hypothetical protein
MKLGPNQVFFKRQMMNVWRITDQDGTQQVNADKAFALMQELVEAGWRMEIHENVNKSVRSVLLTRGKE